MHYCKFPYDGKRPTHNVFKGLSSIRHIHVFGKTRAIITLTAVQFLKYSFEDTTNMIKWYSNNAILR